MFPSGLMGDVKAVSAGTHRLKWFFNCSVVAFRLKQQHIRHDGVVVA